MDSPTKAESSSEASTFTKTTIRISGTKNSENPRNTWNYATPMKFVDSTTPIKHGDSVTPENSRKSYGPELGVLNIEYLKKNKRKSEIISTKTGEIKPKSEKKMNRKSDRKSEAKISKTPKIITPAKEKRGSGNLPPSSVSRDPSENKSEESQETSKKNKKEKSNERGSKRSSRMPTAPDSELEYDSQDSDSVNERPPRRTSRTTAFVADEERSSTKTVQEEDQSLKSGLRSGKESKNTEKQDKRGSRQFDDKRKTLSVSLELPEAKSKSPARGTEKSPNSGKTGDKSRSPKSGRKGDSKVTSRVTKEDESISGRNDREEKKKKTKSSIMDSFQDDTSDSKPKLVKTGHSAKLGEFKRKKTDEVFSSRKKVEDRKSAKKKHETSEEVHKRSSKEDEQTSKEIPLLKSENSAKKNQLERVSTLDKDKRRAGQFSPLNAQKNK